MDKRIKSNVIFILHGWNLSGKVFKPLVSALAKKGYSAYAPDLPGFGSNPPPKTIMGVPQYATWVIRTMKKKNITNAVVIGHSFGGRIGIELAAHYPYRVSKLILTGTPGIKQDSSMKLSFFLILAKIGKLLFLLPGFALFRQMARKILYKLTGSFDYYRSQGIMTDILKRVIAYNLQPLLKKITVPTLLIWGSDDRIVPKAVGLAMERQIPNGRFKEIEGDGHKVPYSHPKKFADTVISFLNTE